MGSRGVEQYYSGSVGPCMESLQYILYQGNKRDYQLVGITAVLEGSRPQSQFPRQRWAESRLETQMRTNKRTGLNPESPGPRGSSLSPGAQGYMRVSGDCFISLGFEDSHLQSKRLEPDGLLQDHFSYDGLGSFTV